MTTPQLCMTYAIATRLPPYSRMAAVGLGSNYNAIADMGAMHLMATKDDYKIAICFDSYA